MAGASDMETTRSDASIYVINTVFSLIFNAGANGDRALNIEKFADFSNETVKLLVRFPCGSKHNIAQEITYM